MLISLFSMMYMLCRWIVIEIATENVKSLEVGLNSIKFTENEAIDKYTA